MSGHPKRPSTLRVLLILGRTSNLPTVWSNCLAAWLISGGGMWYRFSLACLGATLLYTGGMYLNDAFDEAFDRRYRPERPIVSGHISSRLVWILSCVLLLTGWGVFAALGGRAAVFAGLLAFVIIWYDYVHKRTVFAPVLMAACRFILYFLAASSSGGAGTTFLLWKAAALAAYIIGLSYLARGESTGARSLRWTAVLLFAPALAAVASSSDIRPFILPVILFCAWTCWCLASGKLSRLSFLPQGVSGLLAGIALVDMVAAVGHAFAPWFICLFLLALLLQRIAPAT